MAISSVNHKDAEGAKDAEEQSAEAIAIRCSKMLATCAF
jgi:hypothetical protein